MNFWSNARQLDSGLRRTPAYQSQKFSSDVFAGFSNFFRPFTHARILHGRAKRIVQAALHKELRRVGIYFNRICLFDHEFMLGEYFMMVNVLGSLTRSPHDQVPLPLQCSKMMTIAIVSSSQYCISSRFQFSFVATSELSSPYSIA